MIERSTTEIYDKEKRPVNISTLTGVLNRLAVLEVLYLDLPNLDSNDLSSILGFNKAPIWLGNSQSTNILSLQ